MICADAPFVLLDDARANGASPARLYQRPVEQLIARNARELDVVLDAARGASTRGLHVAGFIAYEAGHALEPRLADKLENCDLPTPLAWFGLFEDFSEPDAMALPDPAGAWIGKLVPEVARGDYDAGFNAVEDYIAAGDIYQANLTFRASAPYAGHPLALYAAIRPRAAAGYGGVVWTGEQWFLSFSPELFFALQDGRVTTKADEGHGCTPPRSCHRCRYCRRNARGSKAARRKSDDRRSLAQ